MKVLVKVSREWSDAIEFERQELGQEQMLSPKFQYKRKLSYVSPSERDVFEKLTYLLRGRYHIFPQANLDKFITPNYDEGNIYALRHINQKSVDFLICDNDLRPVLAIELDDPSHRHAERQKRDRVVNGIFFDTGLPLMRIQGINIPLQVLRAALAKHSII